MPPSVTPRVFRILLPARDPAQARRFYETLLGASGRDVAGGRVYLDCGDVIVGLLDYSSTGEEPLPTPAESIYFATRELEAVYARATSLRCLAPGLIHDDPSNPMGEIVTRPWGERSFYAVDPSGNSLCFVDEKTLFTGTPAQVAALAGRRRA
jgi:catechol 2,3-dioxygenase-like lactoylglutathione lyase family enzyme